jgi:hypothetical protein
MGTLIRLQVDHLPGQRGAEPVWLWSSRAAAAEEEVNRAWQAFLRRFDIEHMFWFLKQQLGWSRPKLRDPAAADRWTWLVIAAYAQLHLARGLTGDIRLPGSSPARPAASPRPRPPRVSPHPPRPARSRQRAETLPARTRPPERLEEPPARHPPRRRQNRQA